MATDRDRELMNPRDRAENVRLADVTKSDPDLEDGTLFECEPVVRPDIVMGR